MWSEAAKPATPLPAARPIATAVKTELRTFYRKISKKFYVYQNAAQDRDGNSECDIQTERKSERERDTKWDSDSECGRERER